MRSIRIPFSEASSSSRQGLHTIPLLALSFVNLDDAIKAADGAPIMSLVSHENVEICDKDMLRVIGPLTGVKLCGKLHDRVEEALKEGSRSFYFRPIDRTIPGPRCRFGFFSQLAEGGEGTGRLEGILSADGKRVLEISCCPKLHGQYAEKWVEVYWLSVRQSIEGTAERLWLSPYEMRYANSSSDPWRDIETLEPIESDESPPETNSFLVDAQETIVKKCIESRHGDGGPKYRVIFERAGHNNLKSRVVTDESPDTFLEDAQETIVKKCTESRPDDGEPECQVIFQHAGHHNLKSWVVTELPGVPPSACLRAMAKGTGLLMPTRRFELGRCDDEIFALARTWNDLPLWFVVSDKEGNTRLLPLGPEASASIKRLTADERRSQLPRLFRDAKRQVEGVPEFLLEEIQCLIKMTETWFLGGWTNWNKLQSYGDDKAIAEIHPYTGWTRLTRSGGRKVSYGDLKEAIGDLAGELKLSNLDFFNRNNAKVVMSGVDTWEIETKPRGVKLSPRFEEKYSEWQNKEGMLFVRAGESVAGRIPIYATKRGIEHKGEGPHLVALLSPATMSMIDVECHTIHQGSILSRLKAAEDSLEWRLAEHPDATGLAVHPDHVQILRGDHESVVEVDSPISSSNDRPGASAQLHFVTSPDGTKLELSAGDSTHVGVQYTIQGATVEEAARWLQAITDAGAVLPMDSHITFPPNAAKTPILCQVSDASQQPLYCITNNLKVVPVSYLQYHAALGRKSEHSLPLGIVTVLESLGCIVRWPTPRTLSVVKSAIPAADCAANSTDDTSTLRWNTSASSAGASAPPSSIE